MVLTTHPYPVPRLKKEHSLTLNPPPCPHGLFYSEIDLLNPVRLVQDTVILMGCTLIFSIYRKVLCDDCMCPMVPKGQ